MSNVSVFEPGFERRLAEAREREGQRLSRRERAVSLALAAGFLAAASALAALGGTDRHPPWWAYLAGAAAYAAASRVRFEVGTGLAVPTVIVLVPMLFFLPAARVPLIVAAGLLTATLVEAFRGRQPVARAVTKSIGSSWFSLGPALVVLACGEPHASAAALVVVAAALGAQFAFDAGSTVAGETLGLGIRARELVRPLVWAFAIDVLLAPIGYVTAIAGRVDTWALALPAPLLVLLILFARERTKRLDNALALSGAYRGTAFLLGDVVEADDAYTGAHSREVVALATAVAERFELSDHDARLTEFTALLHDVGKIRIPGEIINKPGPLTAEERAIVNMHTIEGERMLARIGGLLGDVGKLVRSCHERWDGGGYPDGLAGEEIPLVARIVCCCDAYNAMVTDRPYRRALSEADAIAELRSCRGSQFDPRVVDAVLEVVMGSRRADGVRAQALAFDRCDECGRTSLLAEPDGTGHRICLHCGPVPVHA